MEFEEDEDNPLNLFATFSLKEQLVFLVIPISFFLNLSIVIYIGIF